MILLCLLRSTKDSDDEELALKLQFLKLLKESQNNIDNLTSSLDSINAIPPSDIENLETDIEDGANRVSVPFSDATYKVEPSVDDEVQADLLLNEDFSNLCFVAGNSNMIIKHLNDNFNMKQVSKARTEELASAKYEEQINISGAKPKTQRYKDVEERKLNQNLDNFSLRIRQNSDPDSFSKTKKTADKTPPNKEKESKNISSSLEEKQSLE